jgi:hypothetical protein
MISPFGQTIFSSPTRLNWFLTMDPLLYNNTQSILLL